MDTGVGKAAYSVMEQGKIDQVLSSKPEDRRYLFEEAAGISRSKAACQEAERELDKTRTNLTQIEIALAEIKRQYDSLKIQSEKTTKYRKLKDEIYTYELHITLLRLKNFVQDKARHEEELKSVQEKRDKVIAEIDEINSTISANMDSVKAMQEELYSKQAQLIGIGQEKNGKLELIKQQNTQALILKEKISSLEIKKNANQERIETIQEEIDNLESNPELVNKTEKETTKETVETEPTSSSETSEPLNLDSELGLSTEFEETESEEDNLPTPDELGLDLTDNTAVEEEQ